MDFRIEFGPAPDEVTITTEGTAAADDLRRMIDEGMSDPRWSPPMRALLDYTDLDMTGLSADDMREVAAHAAEHVDGLRGARVAVVAPRALVFGMARMSASMLDVPGLEVQVFGERANAGAWLAS